MGNHSSSVIARRTGRPTPTPLARGPVHARQKCDSDTVLPFVGFVTMNVVRCQLDKPFVVYQGNTELVLLSD